MNLFATPIRRKLLFASLYLSEGAPIGFIWLALPTRLRDREIPVADITWLAAILVLPWTFKFVWAPLIDLLRSPRWTLKHWIILAQSIMGITLIPLIWLDPVEHFSLMAGLLFVHALSAATQDVSIDALCIAATRPGERGQYNGWMQAGMMIGRALMGGGALVMAHYIGKLYFSRSLAEQETFGGQAVIVILILLTTYSMILLLLSPLPPGVAVATEGAERWAKLGQTVRKAVEDRNTWLGLLFAATGGAVFKSMEVIVGPFMIDRGYEKEAVGWFTLGPMIVGMLLGALLGGWLTDRFGARRCVAAALIFICFSVMGLGVSDRAYGEQGGIHLLLWLASASLGVGIFTASSYALFMDITQPAIAATQFSAFMGATNGCEAWSSYTTGKVIAYSHFFGLPGYSNAMLLMSLLSLLALPLLATLRLQDLVPEEPELPNSLQSLDSTRSLR